MVGNKTSKDEDHAQTLANGAPKEELATANFVDDEPRYGGEDGIDDHVYTSEQESKVVARADRGLEENREAGK